MSPFTHEKRRRISPKERAEIFAAHDGKCASCGRKIRIGQDWDVGEIDHEIALERGGTNEPSNLRPLCEFCHTAKTSDDHSDASKAKRVFIKQHVPGRFRRSRSWGR